LQSDFNYNEKYTLHTRRVLNVLMEVSHNSVLALEDRRVCV